MCRQISFGGWACLFAVASLLSGCGQRPPTLTPVLGQVTRDGKPVPHAQVQFVPLIQGFGGEYIAEAVTDENGQFELACSMGDGACACENQVIVSEGPLPDEARGSSAEAQMMATQFLASLANRPIPENFGSAAQSPLKVTVSPESNSYNIDLSAATVSTKPK
jgi:hypothetical protein